MRLGKKQIFLLKYAQNHGKIYSFWDPVRLDTLHRKGLLTEGRGPMEYTFYCVTPAGVRVLTDALREESAE